ncbi:hypothetical protein [Moorena sp. SIO4G3]|uniref:hypothetical protein n=1 Tax=Moorena sp. SIO4G3 TaxID=2607821 RepID=UPI0025D9F754|nr:hypothetical protein [Moorena sp. SIO4G3]
MPNVIADTSPIQYLYQTNLLDLLPQLYGSVIVPQAVANELAAGAALKISLLPAPCSRLDAVAHGGNPQDRAASLLPKTHKFVPHKS